MTMNKETLLTGLLFAATAVLIGGAAWFMHVPAQEAGASHTVPERVDRTGTLHANPFGKGESTLVGWNPPAYPDGMAGSSEPVGGGVFRADAQGNLVLDADTKTRLDMLAAGIPKGATPHEMQAVEAVAVEGLPQAAVAKALDILAAYVRYVEAEAQLHEQLGEAVEQPENMLNKVLALRRAHFQPAVADALFGAQEARDRLGIRMALIDADPKLTVQEKLARIDELQQTLVDAPELRAELADWRSALMLEQRVAALREQGAPETQVHQLREHHLGAEASEAIRETETQKFEWERRAQTFAMHRNAIAGMNISEQQKQERIEVLLGQVYTEEEIPVARAYHQLPQLRQLR